jgi:hypothetical protein
MNCEIDNHFLSRFSKARTNIKKKIQSTEISVTFLYKKTKHKKLVQQFDITKQQTI